ncbi:3-beta hydroxysteroid dehydrogenase [Nocardioides sp. SOB77]|uniref:3-beta hydroxysteroid dehydrogenase n=1 Tax=Nocardioides oceani TaxID=3058369 RepID=A0ABT8FMW6_9ACTN|nr:3-beta hydroxysteroid dehydrogenase [Nocardioides oceani]MDN4175527.1 3-beta hydroxysteroid dehydrogenase [Nocardioides oceani]
MRVAVAGGTGLVGTHVVHELRQRGCTPVVLSRGSGVDLLTGSGLGQALTGVDATIDVSNVVTMRRAAAVRFFGTATDNLLDAGRAAGVGHHVVLSIVGIDRVRFGYYDGKLRQEQLALAGPIPATVLRATQFHEFAGQLLDRVPGPVAVLPRQRIRPVAAADVAAELVRLVQGEPCGLAAELAGPEEHQLVDLARRVVRVRGQRRPVVGVRLPGAGGRAMVSGGLLPAEDARHGATTFDDWLAGADRRPAR